MSAHRYASNPHANLPTFEDALDDVCRLEWQDQLHTFPNVEDLRKRLPTKGRPAMGLGLGLSLSRWIVSLNATGILARSAGLLGSEDDATVLVFRDYLVGVRRLRYNGELRLVRRSAPGDIGLGLPALARQAGDEWLDAGETERRHASEHDPIREELRSQLRDLVLAVLGSEARTIWFSTHRGPVLSRSGLPEGDPSTAFAERVATHLVRHLRVPRMWVIRYTGSHPRLASTWRHDFIPLSVVPETPAASTVLHRAAMRAAAARTFRLLCETDAPKRLVAEAGALWGMPAPGGR